MSYVLALRDLVYLAHRNSKDKGFWDDCLIDGNSSVLDVDKVKAAIPTQLCLVHSEVSEALEDYRKDNMEHFGEELADVLIRVGNLAGALGIDLEQEVLTKMQKNAKRPHMHGGKKC